MKLTRYIPHYLIFLGLVVLAAAGIHIFPGGSDTGDGKAISGNIRVAMILPDSIDDQSWNTAGYNGLMLVKKELGAEVAYSQKVSPAQAPAELRRYAAGGFDLIIAHGGQYDGAAEAVAAEFPTVKFMLAEAHPGNNRNLGAISFRNEEMGFLAGAAAGLASRGKAAFVGGEDLPHMLQRARAFEQGAKFVNPNIETKVVFLGTWTDQNKGVEAGKALIAEKFDVIVINADTAGKPIHALAREAGIKTIGWIVDQYNLSPRTVITSAVLDNSQLILNGARLVAKGRWEGKQYKFGLKDGVMYMAPLRGSLDNDKAKKLADIRQALLDGLISPLPAPASSPATKE
ncbi:MAG: BMP family protein [Planctomycetes bacterium]|nr:BMP family protein [Planctomycetota bacterium]